MTRVWDYGGAEGRGPWVMQPHRHTIWMGIEEARALVEGRGAVHVGEVHDALTGERVEEGWYGARSCVHGSLFGFPEGRALVEIVEVAAP